jgi:hypothetical protein
MSFTLCSQYLVSLAYQNSARPFFYPAHEKPPLEEQLEEEEAWPSPEPDDTELKEERSFLTFFSLQAGHTISFSSSPAKQRRSKTLPHLRHLNS